MAQSAQAFAELDNYLTYLEGNRRNAEAIPFLEELVNEHGEHPNLRRALATLYQLAGRHEDAIAQLDAVGEALLNAGDKEGAVTAINQILRMNPPNAEDYRRLLAQIGG
jgi:predicted Zn-dependent protease